MSQHEMTDAAEIREALEEGTEWRRLDGDEAYEHETKRLILYWHQHVPAEQRGWAYKAWVEGGREETGGVDDVQDLPGLIAWADERDDG